MWEMQYAIEKWPSLIARIKLILKQPANGWVFHILLS